jgi:hypothetical protein
VSDRPEWLPDLLLFSSYQGDWDRYQEALYEVFREDFIRNPPPTYAGKRFALKRHPLVLGKEATFRHLISEGPVEAARSPDLRRCERIRWPRALMLAPDHAVRRWQTRRGTEDRPLIALPDFSYVVVLADRGEYVLLWTAYQVEEDHRRRKLRRDYERAQNG